MKHPKGVAKRYKVGCRTVSYDGDVARLEKQYAELAEALPRLAFEAWKEGYSAGLSDGHPLAPVRDKQVLWEEDSYAHDEINNLLGTKP